MITGIGCDIVEHNLATELKWDCDEKILIRIFSKHEIETYKTNGDIKYLSGRFAVKESVIKCLGTGMYDGLALTDIEVLETIEGKPTIELKGEAKRVSSELNISNWHVSISHSKQFSIAYVIAERKTY